MSSDMLLLVAFLIILIPISFAFIKKAYMAPMLVFANVAIFVFVKFYLLEGEMEELITFLRMGLVPGWIAQGEQLQGFFTSMFLHVDAFHVFFNVLMLMFWAPVLESMIGSRKLSVVYIVTGLAGSLLYLLVHWGEYSFLLGASGALFGIAGCDVALDPERERKLLLLFIPLPKMKGYTMLAFMFLVMVALDYIGFIGANGEWNIAHEAHMGGLLAGVLLGRTVIKKNTQTSALDKKYETVTVRALVPLATTPELKNMLEKTMESKEADIVYAWAEGFLEKAKCPHCGNGLGKSNVKKALSGMITCSSCSWSSLGESAPPQDDPK